MDVSPQELSASELRRTCAPDEMAFATTADLDRLEGIIGQERATRAIEFGIEIEADGFNIFAMGPSGAGKSSTILRYLQERARERPTPSDWAYVRNPADAYRPRSLELPPGRGRSACAGLRDVLRTSEDALKSAFSGSLYEEAHSQVLQAFGERQQQILRQLEAFAHQRSFALLRTPSGLTFAPMIKGKTLTAEEYERLSPKQKEAFAAQESELQQALETTLQELHRLQQEMDEELSNLNRNVATATIKPLFDSLRSRFQECETFLAYTREVEEDIVRRVVEKRLLLGEVEKEGEEDRRRAASHSRRWTDDYELNLIVDHADTEGAPVIHEINPSYPNLIGKIEYRAEFGALVPDHHTIRAGALHRANGGYLVIDARAMLSYPMAWEGLKRALRYKEIRIDEPAAQAGAIPAASLAPESIPLRIKVVLIGDPDTYYSLYEADAAFAKLFKVRADFASDMEWSQENLMQMARFIRTRSEEEDLRAFDLGAVAEVVEYAGRLVESQKRLTTRFAHVADVIREADYWAGRDGAELVRREHVRKALDERRFRSNLYAERLQRMIAEGTLMVMTEGAVVGQVNGLSIVYLGDWEFGKPSRITATTYLGSKGIIDIERESHLSGRIHDKGVLILAGYLGQKYGQDKPLNLTASIAFEQSYNGIDGDSASSTELYALLSSLSGLPIKQGIAVTGSVNQHGVIQAVGGVTAKIEGFFDVCKARGLTGDQGVIIPAANVGDLMLRQDVVDAVEAGQFHIWPVETVDEGFSILTGVPAGERGEDGRFPEGTFNRLVDDRLHEMAVALARFPNKEKERREEEPEEEEKEQEDTPDTKEETRRSGDSPSSC
ncbi:MAG: ATP-dependent protease [Caldilineae bacterium]|nr:MAG: ATP-dependent protease [Caldilineae bacterium]